MVTKQGVIKKCELTEFNNPMSHGIIAVSLDEKNADGPGQARASLDRITIPSAALERIVGMMSPRSSLIISDEALSSETGKGTEFVILMSDEPQGGIKFRRRGPSADVRYQQSRGRLPYWPFPFASPYSTWLR